MPHDKAMSAHEYISEVTLDDASIIRRTPEVEHERRVVIHDLVEENSFAPAELDAGPYQLFISVRDNRLTLQISSETTSEPYDVIVALAPFRGVIKDYFMICESYYEAIKHASPHKIEALDMARRGVHNEGSELLKSLLEEKITLDFDTARRLFTLICVLHIK